MSRAIQELVEKMLTPYIQTEGFELVDIEYVKEGSHYYLRVYVDKPGGIEIDDCGRISEYLSSRLDEEDPIPSTYFLEVSSPGAERPLKKPADYARSVGKHVFVTTYEPFEGRKEFEGTLLAYDEVTVQIQDGKQQVTLPVNKIANARLAIKL